MTNHWIDLKNANVHLIMGSNAVENHPIASYWIWKAKEENNCTIIHVDPRFTRTSAKADMYAPMRSGTDIVFLGGMIRWMIENWYTSGKTKYINQKYVEDCTNALFKVNPGFRTSRSADNPGNFPADKNTWDYDYGAPTGTTPPVRTPIKATTLDDPDCVFQKLRQQYSTYTPQMVQRICGTPAGLFEEICEAYCGGTYEDDKAGTMLYAMGWTQHTVGSQNIRTASIVQSLLGNIGVAGGGVDALRGWHNVQGATDHGFLMHLLPGYNPAPQSSALYATLGYGPMDAGDTYLKTTISLAMDPDSPAPPVSKYWWGTFAGQYNRARYVVSNLKAWWPTYLSGPSTGLAIDPQVSYQWLPKRNKDCSYLSILKDIDANIIKGLFCWGTNPMVMGPDQNKERAAMDKLEWLVVCDCFETETSSFWKRPGVTPGTINTEVWFLPGAYAYEKAGSASNSGRLIQWRDKACDPPGYDPADPDVGAKDEVDILNALGAAIISADGGLSPQLAHLAWPVGPLVATGTLAEQVAKETNGYALSGFTTAPIAGATATYAVGQQINTFFHLRSTDETACGNWLFCGTYQETSLGTKVNMMRMRDPIDYHPYKIGIHHKWGYSWPVNRRIIYNRAAVYQSGPNVGKPLNPKKPVVWWDQSSGYGQLNSGTVTASTTTTLTEIGNSWTTNQWVGKKVAITSGASYGHERTITANDANTLTVSPAFTAAPPVGSTYVISVTKWNWNYNDLGKNPATNPMDVVDGFGVDAPGTTLPFIMLPEGVARLMGIKALADGPFPEHWEPKETPLTTNPLTGGTGLPGSPPLSSPYLSAQITEYGATYALTADPLYPYVCTTYRLTEHWHGGGFTRNCPTQYEAQPEPFIEMSEELAADLGIGPGEFVNIYSARNPKGGTNPPVTVKACVTKRWKPYNIDGRVIHEVGVPWHWGWAGMAPGESANILTPFIGDANTRIPETKVFLVNIEKA